MVLAVSIEQKKNDYLEDELKSMRFNTKKFY